MVITFDKAAELKQQISDKFGLYLHLHDACGAQSFSFDEPIDEYVSAWIREYFGKIGGNVQFSESGSEFTVK